MPVIELRLRNEHRKLALSDVNELFVGHIKFIANRWKYLGRVRQVYNSEVYLWFGYYLASDGSKTISFIYNDL